MTATDVPDVVSAQGLAGCIDGECGLPIVGRGRCRRHYARWWRSTRGQHREPALNLKRKTPEERLEAKVQAAGPNDCWPYKGATCTFGHGQFFVSPERGVIPAHVFALEVATGERCPPGKEGCHRCDNPPCCNPAHIYYGTRQDNVDDMVRRGRASVGESRADAKLTAAAVFDIRTRFAAGESQTVLAEEFEVSASSISCLVNGLRWKHVDGPIRTHGRPGRRPTRKEAA